VSDVKKPEPFWRTKSLAEMSGAEWESLCDGCGQCCRLKLEHADTGEVLTTEYSCILLDTHSCRCLDYMNRKRRVPGCLRLTPKKLTSMPWLPATCAYVKIARGEDLDWWHPLVSGSPETVHEAGISVRGKVRPESELDEVEDLVVELLGEDWEEDFE